MHILFYEPKKRHHQSLLNSPLPTILTQFIIPERPRYINSTSPPPNKIIVINTYLTKTKKNPLWKQKSLDTHSNHRSLDAGRFPHLFPSLLLLSFRGVIYLESPAVWNYLNRVAKFMYSGASQSCHLAPHGSNALQVSHRLIYTAVNRKPGR